MSRQTAARIIPPGAAPAESEQRRHPRYAVQYGLRYEAKAAGKTIRGAGMLVDVSMEGCGIQGSCPVKQGDRLTLEIQVSRSKIALRLDGVIVMWASGSRFGVKSEECCKLVSQLDLIPSVPRP